MRLLEFNVNAQQIEKAQNCDFTNIVAGTTGYLRAHFTFSSEWDNCIKVARFWRGGKEHAVCLRDDECDVPAEVLSGVTFGVSVLGQHDTYRITTNRTLVRQEVNK